MRRKRGRKGGANEKEQAESRRKVKGRQKSEQKEQDSEQQLLPL